MPRTIMAIRNHKHALLLSVSLLILLLLLSACGGSGTSNTAMQAAPKSPANNTNSNSNRQSNKQNYGPQYLVKALKIDMQVPDTRRVASDLQSWVTTTDPRATTAGMDYEQIDTNLYSVSMTFSVEASLYTQIESYLRDYAPQHGGRLLDLHETVQDVSNDYIDTQSRLKNLKGEQQRLLTLLSQAQSMSDILTIEQKLTDVEGQIEDIEAHLNALNGQTTFYTISVSLQPTQMATPPPANTSWNPGQVLHDAWGAAMALGQGFLTFILWLLAFSIYIIPAIALITGFIWWRRHQRIHLPPAAPQQ